MMAVDEARDEQLAIAGTILVVMLLFGQIVLLAVHIWLPMTRAADRLTREEDEVMVGEPGGDVGPPAAAQPGPNPWRWAAIGLSVLGAALGLLAAQQLYSGTAERIRWGWVLALSALVIAWGIFTARLISRSAEMFEGL